MAKCTVVSLLPFQLDEPKHGISPSYYNIAAAEAIDKPAILHVDNAVRYVYLDYERGSLSIIVLSKEVAHAIVDDFCRAQIAYHPQSNPDAAPGLFYVEGEYDREGIIKTFPDRLKKARTNQFAWFLELVKIADDDWTRYHTHNAIGDRQRIAARALNIQREWLFAPKPEEIINCIFCTVAISIHAIVCPSCKNVLKQEAFDKLTAGNK